MKTWKFDKPENFQKSLDVPVNFLTILKTFRKIWEHVEFFCEYLFFVKIYKPDFQGHFSDINFNKFQKRLAKRTAKNFHRKSRKNQGTSSILCSFHRPDSHHFLDFTFWWKHGLLRFVYLWTHIPPRSFEIRCEGDRFSHSTSVHPISDRQVFSWPDLWQAYWIVWKSKPALKLFFKRIIFQARFVFFASIFQIGLVAGLVVMAFTTNRVIAQIAFNFAIVSSGLNIMGVVKCVQLVSSYKKISKNKKVKFRIYTIFSWRVVFS